jgi:hypothetical protein
MTRCASDFCARSDMKLRKKIDPIGRLIELVLDFALTTGFLSAMGFPISIVSRPVF